jgi:Flp pilus assembly protein TadG
MADFHIKRSGSKEHNCDVAIFQDMSPKPDSATLQHSRALHPRYLRHRGIALIWTAICILLLILVIGLALDTAKVLLVLHQLQNAADSAALAGAQFVQFDKVLARQQAIMIASQNNADGLPVSLRDNPGNDPDLDVVLGRWLRQTQIFEPATDPNAKNNAVKVVARRIAGLEGVNAGPVPLNFGPIAGVNTVNLTRDAIAMSAGGTGAGLIALAEYPDDDPQYPNKGTGLQIGGNSNVQVNNGAIQVNSWSEDHPWSSFRAMGDFTIDCEELNIRGTVSPLIDDPFWDGVDYSVNEHTGPLPDPLESLPELSPLPAVTVQWGEKTINDSIIQSEGVWSDADGAYVLTIEPGYYPGGITMQNPGSKLVLQPGIYALGGTTKVIDPCTGELTTKQKETGLCINGGTFVAEGVMFYITESLEERYGVVSIQGGTHVSVLITELDTGGGSIYDGMAIFQDRANTEESYVTGSTNVQLAGTLYFKNANFRVGGDGLQAGTQLIAGTVEVDGGSNVIINYDGRNWAPGFKSFLVW